MNSEETEVVKKALNTMNKTTLLDSRIPSLRSLQNMLYRAYEMTEVAVENNANGVGDDNDVVIGDAMIFVGQAMAILEKLYVMVGNQEPFVSWPLESDFDTALRLNGKL